MKKIKLYIHNIEWDVDEENELEDLPIEVELEVPEDKYLSDLEEYGPDGIYEEVSNWLSDEYGFCHRGFDLEERED